jgi:hypothetical protein
MGNNWERASKTTCHKVPQYKGLGNDYLKAEKTGKHFGNGMAFKGSEVQIPSAPPKFSRDYEGLAIGRLPALFALGPRFTFFFTTR